MKKLSPNSDKHPSSSVLGAIRKNELGGMPWLVHAARIQTGLISESDYNIYHESDRFFEVWREQDWVRVARLTAEEALQKDRVGSLIEWVESEIAIDILRGSNA